MYQWVVFLHVLGAFVFMLGHGATSFAMWRISRETAAERIRTLIDVSDQAAIATYGGFVVMVSAGIAAGFMANLWGRGWIWASIGLLVAIYLLMGIFGRGYFERVREAAGAARFKGIRRVAPENPEVADNLPEVIASGRPILMTVTGMGVWAAILWLMMFKPF